MSRPAEMVLAAPAASRRPSAAWSVSLQSRLQPDWYPGEWDAASWTFLGDPDNPKTWVFRSTIPGCGGCTIEQGPFCRRCRCNYIEQGHPADFAATFRPAPTTDPDAPRRFSLADFAEGIRVELLFALQAYTTTRTIVPGRVTTILNRLPAETESLLALPVGFDLSLPQPVRGLFRRLRGVLLRDRIAFDGLDVTADDVWDCGLVGLKSKPYQPYPVQLGIVFDFRPIHHAWLRELVKEFIRSTRPTVHSGRPFIHACVIASRGLLARPDGHRPESLGRADMTAIVEAFETLKYNGAPASARHRSTRFSAFREVLRFGRRSGLLDHVPGSFAMEQNANLQRRNTQPEDMAGRAIPAHVVAQLDAHLQLLGAGADYVCGGWSAEDLRFMHRTIYQVLRDTGRRPEEVSSLKRGCLLRVDGKPSLVYDNHKAKRADRRLPIAESTAQLIQQWRDHLDGLAITADSPWLSPLLVAGTSFAAASSTSATGAGHFDSGSTQSLR